MPKIPTHNKKHFTGLITDLDKILGSKGKTNESIFSTTGSFNGR